MANQGRVSQFPAMELFPLPRLRRRRWLLLAASALFGYGAYKIYHLPAVALRRRKLLRLLAALFAVADAAASSAEAVAFVSSDLNRFLCSDSDDIPSSLKQISKIARSLEFSASVSRISQVLTAGIARGLQYGEPAADSSGIPDRLMDKLLSPAGSGFSSVVAGSFAKGLVMGFYDSESFDGESTGVRQPDSPAVPWWLQLVFRNDSKELIRNCIQVFVSTALTVYLDKTMDINTYDEVFAGLTNPNHEAKMKDMLISVSNGAVETLVRTSHQVITSSTKTGEQSHTQEEVSGSLPLSDKNGGGWVDQIASSLAVSSNRRFVLDVTGRITFETVRSLLDYVLWKMYDVTRREASTAQEKLVGRGLEVVRFFSAKSVVIFTVCLCLCLHISMRTPILISSKVGN